MVSLSTTLTSGSSSETIQPTPPPPSSGTVRQPGITIIVCFSIIYIYYILYIIYIIKSKIYIYIENLAKEKIPADVCGFCCYKGHWVDKCPKLTLEKRRLCFNCWSSTTHRARDCPNPRRFFSFKKG